MNQFKSGKFVICWLIFISLFFSFGFFNKKVEAVATARLYFLPISGAYKVGETIQVRAVVDTGEQAINAIEDNFLFSKDTLEATNISKAGSIITLWVREPSFNNQNGTIYFAGGVPDPGFTGIGRLFVINFKAKAIGKAWLKFSSSAKVLANDGLGTNILASAGRADYEIQKAEVSPPIPVISPEIPLAEIRVHSPSHPDQTKWYQKRDVIFSWNWRQGISDFSYIFSKEIKTILDNISEGLMTSISYLGAEDGVWNFQIKAKTASGWGPITNYKVQIDGTKPVELKIIPQEVLPTPNPSPTLKFEAKDEMSGISYYAVKVDEGEFVKLDKAEYQIPTLSVGKHQVTVRAYDQAENFLEDKIDIEIIPLPAPKITYWTKQILFGEPFVAKGIGVPRAKINLIIVPEKGESLKIAQSADEKGNWTILYTDFLKRGKYQFYVNQEIGRAVSASSEAKSFEVLINAIKILGFVFPINILLWLIIILLIIILILIVLLLFFRRAFRQCDIALRKCSTTLGASIKRFMKKEVKKE